MTKRKIGLFFVIAITVFVASRGGNVRHADANTNRAPATQPTAANVLDSSIDTSPAFDLSSQR
jgi:hypothetical protein